MWPTPAATAGSHQGRVSADKARLGGTLTEAVSHVMFHDPLWPTPRAAEWKGVGPFGSKSHAYMVDKGYLDATVQDVEGRTGVLSPAWVEHLMGWPTGWTGLPPEVHGRMVAARRRLTGKNRARARQATTSGSTG